MQRWVFGARGRRWHFGVGAAVVFILAGTLAVLAVSADAGTSAPRLASVQRAAAVPVGAQTLGAPAADATQTGYVVLKPRDEQSLKSFIGSVTKLHSKQYHQYLKAGQFAAKFGPSSSTIAAVKSQLSGDGLTVTSVARDGLLIGFRGTTTKVESAFRTSLERYRSAAGITGEQTTKAVSLPSTISGDVAAVIGLNTLVHPEANLIRPPKSAYAGRRAAKTANFTNYPGAPDACSDATSAATDFGGLTDDQIANAYGATPLYQTDTGSGVNIGVYELEPFSQSDLATFDNCYFGSGSTPGGLTVKTVDQGQPSGSGSGESILDIEDVSAMAPGAHIDVYEAPNTSAGSLDEYAQMVNDDADQIITSSWGLCEQDLQLADPGAQQAEDYIFQQAAAQGQTVLSAAGDTGDDTCNEIRSVPPPTDQNPLSVEDPASQPYVLAVGGTTIQDADPANYDETVWNDGAEWGGGGGGFSMSWEAPSWQQTALDFPQPGSADYTNANDVETNAGPGTPPALNISDQNWPAGFCENNTAEGMSGTTPCRTVPDVSAQADEFTGAVTIYSASFGAGAAGWITIGGTSSATPIWAAMLALVDASSTCPGPGDNPRPGIGFANPLLYAVAAAGDPTATNSEYHESFHDVTVGNNDVYGLDNGTVFPAKPEYDLASGLGSPILAHGDGTPGLAENLCNLANGTTTTPTVTGLNPSVGPTVAGTSVTVTGSGFRTGGVSDVQSVTIGADAIKLPNADVTVDSDVQMTITMPAAAATLAPNPGSITGQDGAGLANIVVTLSNGTSSPVYPNHSTFQDQFTYADENSGNPIPSVSSISPYAGVNTGGTDITIYGSGFASGDTVTIGGVASTGVVDVVSPWEIKATTPPDNYPSGCVTNSDLDTELGISTLINQAAINICQSEVVVTGSSGTSATTAPLETYLGPLPSATQDGLLDVPSGDELTPVPDEFDYVPKPTIIGVGANTTDGDANADPGSYGVPSVLALMGTGLNYQTMNWFSFGDPTQAATQDTSYPAYADGTNVTINAPADPSAPGPGSDANSVEVTADTLGGVSTTPTCPGVDCVTYAGIPSITSVTTTIPLDPSVPYALAPADGGTGVTIHGYGLSDVTGPLEFADLYSSFSVGNQYQYTGSDTAIDTDTVRQNPAIVDTYVCSDSGCYPSTQQQAEDEDQILLYPDGNPVITSLTDASGPALGGTLVTINGQNLGCVTGVKFGTTVAESFADVAALLDCGSSSQAVVIAPPGMAGQSVPITLTTVESDVTGAPDATSLNATSPPTEFTYDTVNPSVPGSVAFGSVNLGQSSTETVTLSNPALATQLLYPEPDGAPDSNGSQSPLLASIGGSSAGDFTITSDGCSGQALYPEQSCSFQMQFAPGGLGSRSATLDIPFNYSQSVANSFGLPSQTPDLQVALNGTGTEPTNTVTTPGTTTTKTVTKTIRKTCTITVRWRWVTVKVHGKKKREHKKFTHRSKGCKKRRR
jgi:hypothetical protein